MTKVEEIATKVWQQCGWGTGEPDCAEGHLCKAAVKAGYEAGLASAPDSEAVAALVEAAKAFLAIADRNTDACNRLRAALAALEGKQ